MTTRPSLAVDSGDHPFRPDRGGERFGERGVHLAVAGRGNEPTITELPPPTSSRSRARSTVRTPPPTRQHNRGAMRRTIASFDPGSPSPRRGRLPAPAESRGIFSTHPSISSEASAVPLPLHELYHLPALQIDRRNQHRVFTAEPARRTSCRWALRSAHRMLGVVEDGRRQCCVGAPFREYVDEVIERSRRRPMRSPGSAPLPRPRPSARSRTPISSRHGRSTSGGSHPRPGLAASRAHSTASRSVACWPLRT